MLRFGHILLWIVTATGATSRNYHAAPTWETEREDTVLLDGSSALVWRPESTSSWASSGSFAVGLWFRLDLKEKNDHEEMCLLSHGSWEGRFKLSLLPWRVLRFTVRNIYGGVVDCDGDSALRPQRWYHIAASYDQADGKVQVFLNGHQQTRLRCNPPRPIASPSHANRHSPGSTGGANTPRGQSSASPANPAPRTPVVVGACGDFGDQGHRTPSGGRTDTVRGSFSDLRYWPDATPRASEVQAGMFNTSLGEAFIRERSGEVGRTGTAWSALSRHGVVAGERSEERESGGGGEEEEALFLPSTDSGEGGSGNIRFEVRGEPRWVPLQRGDQLLSATLTVAEANLEALRREKQRGPTRRKKGGVEEKKKSHHSRFSRESVNDHDDGGSENGDDRGENGDDSGGGDPCGVARPIKPWPESSSSSSSSSSWCSLVSFSSEATTAALASGLSRHFRSLEDEAWVWGEVHELRARVESLGHALAMTTTMTAEATTAEATAKATAKAATPADTAFINTGQDNKKEFAGGHNRPNGDSDYRKSPPPPSSPPPSPSPSSSRAMTRIAIVAPSTSKGVPLPESPSSSDGMADKGQRGKHDDDGGGGVAQRGDDQERSKGPSDATLRAMPLYAALLKSLYSTCEPAYLYAIFVCANQGDPVLGSKESVARLFELARSKFGGGGGQGVCSVGHALLLAPDSMVPRTSLSALFNWPTLVAVNSNNADAAFQGSRQGDDDAADVDADTEKGGGSEHGGADYVYLANDDLLLTSSGWTSKFVHALQGNPVWPNLGVAGAVDTSDTATPQIEFPFFHRTHAVSLFGWCGATPWVFRNWFEDNWLSDVYAPFGQSVFYLRDVTVENYGGLMRTASPSQTSSKPSPSSSMGSTDPRYALRGGRRVPDYYVREVEAARRLVWRSLVEWGADPTLLPPNDGRALGYCTAQTIAGDAKTTAATTATTTTKFSGGLRSTLGLMPVGPHQPILDPCLGHANTAARTPDSWKEQEPWRRFERTVMETEAPPHRPHSLAMAARPFPSDTASKRGDWRKAGNNTSSSLKGGTQEKERSDGAAAPADSGNACSSSDSSSSDNRGGERVCGGRGQLRIAVIHHHVPLYSRYGCDQRLFSVLTSLVLGLGHSVAFGGKHVSDFETAEDKARLPDTLGVPVVAPLAFGEEVQRSLLEKLLTLTANLPLRSSRKRKSSSSSSGAPLTPTDDAATPLPRGGGGGGGGESRDGGGSGGGGAEAGPQGTAVDVVVLTLWFWSTAPLPRDFLPLVRAFSPSTKILLLSDDVHFLRLHLLGAVSPTDVDLVRKEELAFYRAADAVATITDEDARRLQAALSGVGTADVQGGGRDDEGGNEEHASTGRLQSIRRVPMVAAPSSSSSSSAPPSSFHRRRGLVLVGNGANPVNAASAVWFLKDVWPAFLRRLAECRRADGAESTKIASGDEEGVEEIVTFTLIGADWDETLPNLAASVVAAAAAAAASADIPPVTLDPDKRHSWKEEAAEARPPPFSLSPSSSSRQEDQLLLRPVRGRVALRGFLADESALAAELLTHRVFASPIVGSTGLNTKNILALEHGVPLVTTPLGAEGMHLPVPHPPFNLTSAAPPVVGVAEDAEGFAAALVQVYINESLWHVRAAGGKRHLQANFSSGAQQSALEVLLESLWKIRLPK